MTRARGASRPRFRLIPTILLTLAILGLPTVVYAWGRSSSSFDIAAVKVTGTNLVPAKKTLKLLHATYVGDNLFTVTAKDVKATLRPVSFVAGVKIDRDFPDTLRVAITEYEPAAYALAGGRWYVLDQSGYVICEASDARSQIAKARGGKKTTAPKAGATATATATASPTATPDPSASDGASSTATSTLDGETTGSTDATTGGAGTATDGTGTATDGATGATGSTASTTAAADAAGLTARLVAGPADAVLPLPRLAISGRIRQGVALSDAASTEMLTVITALPVSLQRSLAAVEDDDGQLTLRFAGGPVVAWGDAARTLAKTVALRTVLAAYADAGKDCTQADVSIPDRTLAKPVLE